MSLGKFKTRRKSLVVFTIAPNSYFLPSFSTSSPMDQKPSESKGTCMEKSSQNEPAIVDDNDDEKRRSSSTSTVTVCQVEKCTADLSEVRSYHRRHKVCETHSKAPSAMVTGRWQRFCQQCSRVAIMCKSVQPGLVATSSFSCVLY